MAAGEGGVGEDAGISFGEGAGLGVVAGETDGAGIAARRSEDRRTRTRVVAPAKAAVTANASTTLAEGPRRCTGASLC